MNEPKHVSNYVYPLVKTIFIRWLSRRHGKPFNDIKIANMSDAELKRWQEVEALNGTKLGVSFSDNVDRKVVN
ncbi:MAG: hypothetical protein ACR2ON_08160 [Paracoccaceae bacterium]|jgi:hypothetical protein